MKYQVIISGNPKDQNVIINGVTKISNGLFSLKFFTDPLSYSNRLSKIKIAYFKKKHVKAWFEL